VFASREKAVESYCRVTGLNLHNQARQSDGLYTALLCKGHRCAQRYVMFSKSDFSIIRMKKSKCTG
jgi:hypothetical protein